MGRRVVLALLALALAPAPFARGGDDESGEPARIDLSPFRAAPVAKSARLTWVPTDPMYEDAWTSDPIGEEAAVASFAEPPFADHAVSPESVEDLVRRLVPESARAGWADKATKDVLEVWSTAEGGEKARRAVRFVEQAMAPRLSVRATLSAAKGSDGAPRLLAVGAVRLLPRRWTTVWARTHQRRFVAFYEMEIAQETVANKPVVAALPEGEELHLRWSPGEKSTLLEVYTSETSHRPPFELDLSGIRNVPEANAPGSVQLPRTAVRRAQTAVSLDAGKPSTAEWTWEGPDGARTLRLSVEAVAPGPADVEMANGVLGVVRAGAAAAALDDTVRDSGLEEEIERFQAGSSGGARGVASPEQYAQAFLLCEGPKAQVERLRAQVQADERALAPATVELRAVTAPSAVLREDVEAGRVAVGAVLDATTAATYLRATAHAAARVPVTSGLRASVQCGASVMGLAHADVEVAQQAGGIYVSPRARFDGLVARVRVQPGEGGVSLHVSGAVSWARPDGSSLDLAFRRPLGMQNANGSGGGVDNPEVRRFPVPIESHGQAAVEAAVVFSTAEVAEGRWAVLSIALRPGNDGTAEPLLLLGSVRR